MIDMTDFHAASPSTVLVVSVSDRIYTADYVNNSDLTRAFLSVEDAEGYMAKLLKEITEDRLTFDEIAVAIEDGYYEDRYYTVSLNEVIVLTR